MNRVFANTVALAFAAMVSVMSAEGAWRRIDYPDYTRRWPQMKGVMLGSSTEKEFTDLRSMGANLVRYQMNADWKQFAGETDPIAAFNKWLDGRLDHLDEMLPWARRCGIKVCVDMHTHLGGFTDEKNNSDMIFVEKKYEDLLVATWEKIATRFKGNQDAIYGYDLFNEPINRENKLTKRTWRAVMCRTIDAIRAIDPVTPIVVEPNCHASPRGYDVKNIYGLKGFEPLSYDNLIYSVHVYQPMEYTHQGIHQAKDAYKPVAYPNAEKGWDKEFLRKQLQSVRYFQLKTGARIYVGEFSAAAYAPGAEKYLADLCDLFLEFGWDWIYHAFRESTCWSFEHEGASFDTMKPASVKTKRREVIEKYLKDDRIQGFVAGQIKYPARLSPEKRFRGALDPYPHQGNRMADAKALGMNIIRAGVGFLGPDWAHRHVWPVDDKGRAVDVSDEAIRQWIANAEANLLVLKETLDKAQALGMKVVVTGPAPGKWLTTDAAMERMYFQDPELLALMVSFWHKTAKAFKGHPALYGYDIVNEPLNREYPKSRIKHRDFMILCARAIRDEDPDATLIVECNADGAPAGFDCKSRYGFVAMTPIPFDNVIYSVHVYQPMGFTHQGIGKKKDEYLHHSYPTTQAKLDENRQRFPGDLGQDTDKPEDWNKDYIRNAIKSVREFQLKYGARIYVGEFSAASWTDGGDRYLQDVTDLFEAYGWDYTYHAFRENVIWSLEHEGEENASLRKAKEETPRMKVMKAKWALNAR